MKKFNVAFLPLQKGQELILLSKKLIFLNPEYQLGDTSLPHLTLCQFYAEESDIDTIWDNICDNVEVDTINLEFSDFSFVTFDNVTYWISLLPKDSGELHILHSKISSIVHSTSNKPYDPHLTLISTKDNFYEFKGKPVSEGYKVISDRFILSLGECDSLGQFTRILKQPDIKNHFVVVNKNRLD